MGRVLNQKDISPRVGLSYDLFGNGRTALKVSVARYVAGQGLAAASITDNNNPENTVGLTDQRAWADLDGNGSPFSSSGVIQLNELTNSVNTANFGRNVPTTQVTNPALLEGWGVARLQLGVHRERAARADAARLAERRLVPPQVRQPDHHRRPALQHREGQLRWPVLRERAGEPEPAGRRRLSGLRPVRSEAVGRRAEPPAEQPAHASRTTSAARRTSTPASTCRSTRGRGRACSFRRA